MAAAPSAVPAAVKEVPAVSCDVKYHGFVYVNGGDGLIPGRDKVEEAFKLLKNTKKAQKAHLLFARGSLPGEVLKLRCSEQGLKLFERKSSEPVVRLGILIHKIAFVMNKDKSVIWLKNRRLDSTADQFQCYGIETSSKATAKQLAQHIVATCNSVFRKLRRTRKKVKAKVKSDGKVEPKVASLAPPSSEEAERLRKELQAEVDAAKAYRESLATALADLGGDSEDGPDDDEAADEMVEDMAIHYEEFADEFAKISLEIAERVASGDRRTLMISGSGEETECDVDGDVDALPIGELDFSSGDAPERVPGTI